MKSSSTKPKEKTVEELTAQLTESQRKERLAADLVAKVRRQKVIQQKQQELQRAIQLQDRVQQVRLRLVIADALLLNREIDKAIAHYTLALDIAQELKNQEQITHCLIYLGACLSLAEKYDDALAHYRQARVEAPDDMSVDMANRLAKHRHDHDQVYQILLDAQTITDTLPKKSNTKRDYASLFMFFAIVALVIALILLGIQLSI